MARLKGENELRRKLRKMMTDDGVKSIKIGFFSHAKYSDGTPVAAVAAWNEFGHRGGAQGGGWGGPVPERPFFRNAIREFEDEIPKIKNEINVREMTVDEFLANSIGLRMRDILKNNIIKLRQPPNAPATIEIKRLRSTNPLIDTGFMELSADYQVEK